MNESLDQELESEGKHIRRKVKTSYCRLPTLIASTALLKTWDCFVARLLAMTRSALFVSLVAAFNLAVILARPCSGGTPPGEDLSTLEFETVEGKPFPVAKSRAKVLLLVFVRSDQEPSKKALESVERLCTSLGKEGFEAFAIVPLGKDEQLEKEAFGKGRAFSTLIDRGREVSGSLRVIVTPTTFVLDEKRTVVVEYPGYDPSYERVIEGWSRFAFGMISRKELDRILTPPTQEQSPEVLKASRHIQLAKALVEHGQEELALAEVVKATEVAPEYVPGHIEAGLLYLTMEKYEEALARFEKALKLEPENHEALLGMGMTLSAKGKLDEAEQTLLEAIRLNPRPERAHYELGKVYEKKGDKERALFHYKEALKKIFP